VQRVLEAIGKPVGRLFQIARESRNPALRGISDRVQGWVQEGLIKTVQAANRLTKPEDVMRRVEAMDIHVADIESMRYLPMSKLDHIADSSKQATGCCSVRKERYSESATTLAEGVPGAQLLIPSLILADVTASMTLLGRQTCLLASVYGFSPKLPENLPHVIAALHRIRRVLMKATWPSKLQLSDRFARRVDSWRGLPE
jgi:hypothetical protein